MIGDSAGAHVCGCRLLDLTVMLIVLLALCRRLLEAAVVIVTGSYTTDRV